MKNKKIVLFDIDYTIFDTDHFKKSKLKYHKIYPEVREALKRLSRIAVLGIFSEGELDFQSKKLIDTGIYDFFDKKNTHIVLSKLTDLKTVLTKYQDRKIFFVDDKLEILYETKKMLPNIFVVWMKRGIYAISQKEIIDFKPDAEVTDLRELINIVKD